jgi:hypothetical protein
MCPPGLCLPACLQLGPPPRPSPRRPRRLPAPQRTFPWTKQVGSRTPGSGSHPVASTPACPLPVTPRLVCSALLVCLRRVTLPPTPPACLQTRPECGLNISPWWPQSEACLRCGAKPGGPCSTHSPAGLCRETATTLRCCCYCGLLPAPITACVPPGASLPSRADIPEGGGGTPQQGARGARQQLQAGSPLLEAEQGWVAVAEGGRTGGQLQLLGVTYAASAHGAWWAMGSPWALIC